MGSNAVEPKIILYTNHRCPWAHRAHIALDALQLPHEEVIIELDRPRDPWYLEVNPRGLVPSLSYNGTIVTESAIVAAFLADAHPSQLNPPSTADGGALHRARVAFFVDAYHSKVQSHIGKLGGAKTDEAIEGVAQAAVAAVVKELEPLLEGAKPFFGGSGEITLAETLTGPFVLRLVTFVKAGVYPASIASSLEAQAPRFWAWAEAVAAHPAVTKIFNADKMIEATKARLARARAA